MSVTEVMPDTEGALRDWLRTQTRLTDLVGNRIFFGVPESVTFPCITVQQIAGGPQAAEAPIVDDVLQLDCWSGVRNKTQAALIKNVLVALLHAMSNVELNASTHGYGARVESVVWLPDPADDRARYVVTASVTARAA